MTFRDWQKSLIAPSATIFEAMRALDESSAQIALVVEADRVLTGTLTDGDIRRALLRGLSLDTPVETIMQRDFTALRVEATNQEIQGIMRQKDLKRIPILDDAGRVVDLRILEEMALPVRDNWVVLMAGGLGTRLHPLTLDCPKPLLQVGDRPLLETIIEKFVSYGFRNFFISVNYMADMIEDCIRDGSRWGVRIQYLREREKLGTAGPLSLLPERPRLPVIVMNGDVLTTLKLPHLLAFHDEHRASGTMCVREYSFQVPYGVIETNQHIFQGITEKPVVRYLVNAGIYVLSPEAIDLVPPNAFYNMPDLFTALVANDMHSVVFPIPEYWMDIGLIDDFRRANAEYPEVFK